MCRRRQTVDGLLELAGAGQGGEVLVQHGLEIDKVGRVFLKPNQRRRLGVVGQAPRHG